MVVFMESVRLTVFNVSTTLSADTNLLNSLTPAADRPRGFAQLLAGRHVGVEPNVVHLMELSNLGKEGANGLLAC